MEYTHPLSATTGVTPGSDGLQVPLVEAPWPQRVLCNEDDLSDFSDSSLSITSPIVSKDGDNRGGTELEPDESETESSDEWEDDLEGLDPNKGQNLHFRLQAAAAGMRCAPCFMGLR